MRVPVCWRDGFAVSALISAVVGGALLAHQSEKHRSAEFWSTYVSAASVAADESTRPARRVIALSLAAEEVLLDLVGPDRLAAVTPWARQEKFSNVSAKASAVVATVNGQSIERILRLEPDAVVVAPYTDLRAKRILRRAGVRVVELSIARSFAQVRESVQRLGGVLGADNTAAALLEDFEARIKATRERAAHVLARRGGSRPRLLYIGTGFESPWTAGKATLLDEILTAVGVINVAAEQGVLREAPLSREAVLRWSPDILLMEGQPGERDRHLADLRADGVLSGLPAVEAGRVIVLPARLLTTASHYVAHTAEKLVAAVEKLPERPL